MPTARAAALGVLAPTERDFQRSVVDLCRLLGLWHFHVADSRRCPPGWPDLVIIGRRAVIYRELKTERGRLRPEQAEVGQMLTSAGQDWTIWRPRDLASGRVLAELRATQNGDRAA